MPNAAGHPSSRISVWSVPLDLAAPTIAALAPLLDTDETRRAATRRPGPVRDRFVVAHAATRNVLGHRLGADPAALRIARRCEHCGDPAHGRPVLVDAPALAFSLTHAGGRALVALGWDVRLGVDVEELRPRARLDRLAARVLSDDEHAVWRTRAEEDRLRSFLVAWTAKEAYLKAIGLGITGSLREVRVAPDGWRISPLDVGVDHVASLAIEGEGEREVDLHAWKPDLSANGGTAD